VELRSHTEGHGSTDTTRVKQPITVNGMFLLNAYNSIWLHNTFKPFNINIVS
jgi:hypothetical protein